MRLLFFVLILCLGAVDPPQPIAPQAVQEDFEALRRHIDENYAYFDRKIIRWSSIPATYASALLRVETQRDLLMLLECVVDELYDHHAHLTANTASSWRLVPAGADMWAEWRDGRAIVVEVRAGSDAERAGITVGTVVLAVGGVPIAQAIQQRLGRSLERPDDAARSWALRSVLAGRRTEVRSITYAAGGATRRVELPAAEQAFPRIGRLAYRILPRNHGYIRIHDSLGAREVIADFDDALAALGNTSALILDLRDTPSGGTTTVARGILGRFVSREQPYQKHALPSEGRKTGVTRSWLELVSPRGPFRYTSPVAVLVNHWTGSMGEGLAIGFDATGAGIVVGTPMAGLLGATYHFQLPNSRIGVNVPTEKLFHVNGTPREAFVPRELIDPAAATPGSDPWIARAQRVVLRGTSR